MTREELKAKVKNDLNAKKTANREALKAMVSRDMAARREADKTVYVSDSSKPDVAPKAMTLGEYEDMVAAEKKEHESKVQAAIKENSRLCAMSVHENEKHGAELYNKKTSEFLSRYKLFTPKEERMHGDELEVSDASIVNIAAAYIQKGDYETAREALQIGVDNGMYGQASADSTYNKLVKENKITPETRIEGLKKAYADKTAEANSLTSELVKNARGLKTSELSDKIISTAKQASVYDKQIGGMREQMIVKPEEKRRDSALSASVVEIDKYLSELEVNGRALKEAADVAWKKAGDIQMSWDGTEAMAEEYDVAMDEALAARQAVKDNEAQLFYVNGLKAFASLTENQRMQLAEYVRGGNYKENFKQIKSSMDKDEFERMYETLCALENAVDSAKREVKTIRFAETNPVTASIASVFTSLIGGVSAVGGLALHGIDNFGEAEGYKKPIDVNSWAFEPTKHATVTRGTVADDIEKNAGGTGGKIASFLYRTGMSGVDSLAASFTGNPGGALLLGTSSASNAFLDAKERGASDSQALWTGLLAGVFETLFERVSIGNLNALKEVDVKSIKDILKNIGRSALVNATEEGLTEAATAISDYLINKDLSVYGSMYKELVASGTAPEEAKKQTLNALLKDVGIAAAGGAIMGVGFAGGTGAVNYAKGKTRDAAYKKTLSFAEQLDSLKAGTYDVNLDLYVSETPEIYTRLGFSKSPTLMRNGKIAEIYKKHPEMTEDVLKQIPQAFQNPLLILKSKTHSEESVVAITQVETDKGPMIIPVWVNQDGTYLNIELGEIQKVNTNFVATAYGRNVQGLLQYAIENDGFLYSSEDKEKVGQLFALYGLQLPTPLKLSDSDIRIPQSDADVNSNYMQSFDNNSNNFADETEFRNADGTINMERANELIQKGLSSGEGSTRQYAKLLQGKGDKVSEKQLAALGRTLAAEQAKTEEKAEAFDIANSPSTSMKFDKAENYAPDKRKTIKEYLGAVNEELVSFIQRVKNGEKTRPWFNLGKVNKRTSTDVKRLTGIDVADYEHGITPSDVRHIENYHGENGKSNSSMRDDNDLARAPYVLENYDTVELLDDTTGAISNSDNTPAQLVKFAKKINGSYYVVEAVPDSSAKKMRIISAYISAKEVSHESANAETVNTTSETQLPYNADSGVTTPLRMANAPQMYVQDVRNDTATNSISQLTEKSQEGDFVSREGIYSTEGENGAQGENFAAVRDTLSDIAKGAFDIAMESTTDKDAAATQFRIKYLEGETGAEFTVDEDSELTPSMQEAAYKYGAEAKASLGTVTYNTRTKVSDSLSKSFEKAAKDLNVHITYGGKAPVVNGVQDRAYITSAGELRIYEDVEVRLADGRVLKGDDAATMVILGHEMTHRLQALDEKSYNAFREFVLARKSGAIEGYIKMGLSQDAAADEIVADYAMTTLFADQKTINEVTKKHSKLAEAVRDILEWIKTKLGIKSSELDRAIRLWNDAYNASVRNGKSSVETKNTADGDVKYSRVKNINGIPAYESDFPPEVSDKQREKIFRQRIGQIFALGAVKLKTDTKRILVEADRFTWKKTLYGDEIVNPEERKAIINSLYDLVDILENSTYVPRPKKDEIEPSYANPSIPPKNKAHEDVKYWYKFENRVYIDEHLYDVVFNIRDKGKEQYEYLIEMHQIGGQHKKKNPNINGTANTSSLAQTLSGSPNNNVPQNVPVVNTQSMQKPQNNAGKRQKSVTGTEELLFASEADKVQYVADSFDLSGAETYKATGSMERMSAIANSIAKAHRINKDGRVKLAKALEKGVQNMRKAAKASLTVSKNQPSVHLPDVFADANTKTQNFSGKTDDAKVKQTAAEGFLEAAMIISPDADVQAQVEIANALAESVWAEMTTDRLPETIRSIRDEAINAARADVRAERLAQLGEKYGTIKPGERPSRAVTLPKKTSEGKKVSQTVRTVMEAEAAKTVAKGTNTEYNNTYTEADDGRKVYLRDGGERTDGENTGKQVRVLAEGTGRNQGRQTKGEPRDSEAASLTLGKEVSTASFYIPNGSKTDKIYRIAGSETTAMKNARAKASERGLNVVFFAGGNLTVNGKPARGYISGKNVVIRADDPEFTADQIMEHEIGHDKIAKGEIDLDTVKDRLNSIYGEETVDFICQQYVEAYEGSNLAPEKVFEEMVCDSLGDMNAFDSESEIREAADSFLATTKAVTEASTRAATNPDALVEGKASSNLYNASNGKYDYSTLTNKPDMTITVIDDTIQYPTGKEALKKARVDILKDALSNAAQIGYVNNSNQVFVRVNDIGTNVMLAKNGLKHGLDRRLQANAAATIKAGEILQNAIRINELTPDLETASGAYVLLGAAKNSSNELYIVEFVVNKFDDKIISMDVLYSANAKKESAVQNAPESTENPLLVTDSTISIAQLLDFAREKFPDVLPESVLRHFGFDSRPEGKIGESALYSHVLPSDRTSKPLTAEQKEIWKRVQKMTPMQIANMQLEDIDPLPKRTPKAPSGINAENGKESRFYDSAMDSDNVAEDTKRLIKTVDDIRYYAGISNEETLNEANDRLNLKGQTENNRFLTLAPNSATAIDVAEGFILLKRYQDNGDFESACVVARKLREIGTSAGQTVQTFSILGRLTPEGMAIYAQKELDAVRDEMIKKHSEAWVEQRKDMFSLSAEEMQFINDTMIAASRLPDGREKNILIAKIASMLEEKLPKKVLRQIQAYTRVSMLLNSKTMLRNVLGNAIMMPMYVVEDFVGAGFDLALSKDKRSGVRTKGRMHFDKETGKAALKGVYESYDDFRKHVNTREIQNDRFELGNGDAFRHYSLQDFKDAKGIKRVKWIGYGLSDMLNAVDRINSFLLDMGDRPFFEFHFTNSINNQLRLNHTTEPTADMIRIATAEALQRTWQDDNAFTKAASQIRNMLNGGKSWGIGSIIVPFTKTPTNLTKALIEYSPVGLVKAVTYNAHAYKNSLQNANPDPMVQKAFVDSFAKGVTGTLATAIAYLLANAGLISGGDDDKDKDLAAFEKNIMGVAPYSVTLNGKSYSYDWAQPVGGIFAITADYVQNVKAGNGPVIKGLDALGTYGKPILNALSAGGNVLFEQSFLQGVSELFGDDGLMGGLISSVANAPTQAIPTALSQIAQMCDPYARTSYVYRDTPATAANKVKAKLPWKRDELAPVVDVLGHDVLAYGGNNAWYNVLLNPTNIYSETASDAAKEIYRVYEETGDATIIPRVAPYYFEYGGERYTFTPHERADYQRATGSANERIVNDLKTTYGYMKLSDEDKAKVLAIVTDYVTANAKYEYLAERDVKYERDSWMIKAAEGVDNGVTEAEYIVAKTVTKGIDKGLPDKNGETYENSKSLLIMEAIYSIPNLSDEQRKYLFESFGVGKRVIGYTREGVKNTLSKMRAKTY